MWWEWRASDSYPMISQPTPGGKRINQPIREIVNVTKPTKKHPFAVHISPTILDFFQNIVPLHPPLNKNEVG